MKNQLASSEDSTPARAWLKLMEPNESRRSDLLAAGVSKHTAYALYPASFSDFVPKLCDHLREHKLEGLRGLQEDLDHQLTELHLVRDLLPGELAERYFDEFNLARSPAIRDLRAELREQLVGVELSPDNNIFIAGALWNLWWFLHNREELPESLRETVDSAARWFGIYLLRLPELMDDAKMAPSDNLTPISP